ncbi:MAG: high light inducible protein [Phormidesmis sp.]
MKNETPLVPAESNIASAALDNKTLGVSATRYYKPEPRLGFTPYAELWNGRLAMVGFFVALIFELLSAHAF